MLSKKSIILMYFFIGFVSDLILNYLSVQDYAPKPIKAMEFYFKRKTIKNKLLRDLISASYAGLTIVVAVIITMIISSGLFGFSHPLRLKQLYKFMITAFIVGYIMDVIIYKIQLFGDSLNPYYEATGAGLWGALAFIFSILTVYVLTVYL